MTLSPKLRVALGWGSRLLVAGVFLVAAIPKLQDPLTFAEDIQNYDAFPDFSAHFLAAMVPILELLAALALFIPRFRDGAVAIIAALDFAFIALIASVLVRGIDIRCGCFGGAAETEEAMEESEWSGGAERSGGAELAELARNSSAGSTSSSLALSSPMSSESMWMSEPCCCCLSAGPLAAEL